MRLKYPALISHAMASSAPVLATYDFVQYMEVVTASLTTGPAGTACTDLITAATNEVQSLLTTPAGVAQLTSTFQLCEPPTTNNDIANFVSTIAGAFMVRAAA